MGMTLGGGDPVASEADMVRHHVEETGEPKIRF